MRSTPRKCPSDSRLLLSLCSDRLDRLSKCAVSTIHPAQDVYTLELAFPGSLPRSRLHDSALAETFTGLVTDRVVFTDGARGDYDSQSEVEADGCNRAINPSRLNNRVRFILLLLPPLGVFDAILLYTVCISPRIPLWS
jgi:hypothetical protein